MNNTNDIEGCCYTPIADFEVRRQSEEWRRVLEALEMALEKRQNNPECESKDALGNIRTAIREVIEKHE